MHRNEITVHVDLKSSGRDCDISTCVSGKAIHKSWGKAARFAHVHAAAVRIVAHGHSGKFIFCIPCKHLHTFNLFDCASIVGTNRPYPFAHGVLIHHRRHILRYAGFRNNKMR